MAERSSRKLAVILHADVVDSTALVRNNETLAQERIQDVFQRLSKTIESYGGTAHEVRGDALVAEFDRASDAIAASLAFQQENQKLNSSLKDDVQPHLRIGIAMGEVVIVNNTVTGEGVVLAQRLEQLAESGGVCIQDAAYKTVPKRLPFEYEYLGERELKGFDEAERIFAVTLNPGAIVPSPEKRGDTRRINPGWRTSLAAAVFICAVGLLAWFQPWAPEFQPVSVEKMAFPLPDKPSIAVLPFSNMSDDPKQEYFVDGMTEDVITDLSKLSGLFVIARNSTFTYKGKSVEVRQVAKDLGVRYVLEGSVRLARGQVRINAQLIDATTGGHLWAERFDGDLTDIFAVQDRVTNKIVAALAINLTPGEQVNRSQQETVDPRAYDAFLQGWDHYRRWNIDAFGEAVPFFKKAVALDPDYSRAHAALASIYWYSWRRWGESGRTWPAGMGVKVYYEAYALAKEYLALAMEHPTSLAHQVASRMHLRGRRYEEATAEAERAVALDPNDADNYAQLAYVLAFAGRPSESVSLMERAMRLDPHYPPNYLGILGVAKFALGKLDETAALFERRYTRNPKDQALVAIQLAAYGLLGRDDDARTLLGNYVYQSHTVTALFSWWPFKDIEVTERFGRGVVKAGVCCRAELEEELKRMREAAQIRQ